MDGLACLPSLDGRRWRCNLIVGSGWMDLDTYLHIFKTHLGHSERKERQNWVFIHCVLLAICAGSSKVKVSLAYFPHQLKTSFLGENIRRGKLTKGHAFLSLKFKSEWTRIYIAQNIAWNAMFCSEFDGHETVQFHLQEKGHLLCGTTSNEVLKLNCTGTPQKGFNFWKVYLANWQSGRTQFSKVQTL